LRLCATIFTDDYSSKEWYSQDITVQKKEILENFKNTEHFYLHPEQLEIPSLQSICYHHNRRYDGPRASKRVVDKKRILIILKLMISFDKVSKIYQKDWIALQDISFEIEKGEFVFVCGSTGAGKTTLLKLIYKDEDPTRGSIKVLNQNLKDIRKKEIPKFRRKIGVVFQDFKLLQDRTLEENVAFSLEVTDTASREIRKKLMETLTYLRLSHKKYAFPYQLSGGEQQKVAIARALVRDPYILLADEPTGNLDAKSSEEITNILLDINYKGTTVLMATHSISLVKKMKKRMLRIEDCRLTQDK
jgi:cell division transport system ATP-binding protein